MRRYIKSSVLRNIDTYKLTNQLIVGLKQFLPKNCRFIINPRYDGMKIENCPSNERLKSSLVKALSEFGYDVRELGVEGSDYSVFFNFAAIKDEAWAHVSFTRVDYDNYVEIFVNCDKGNVIFEDWYDDDEIEASETIENQVPPGFLSTTKFTTPSIKTDDQRNALEALEIAISEKFQLFDKMCERAMYLNSEASWEGYIYEYEEGYYIDLTATRSSFTAFVAGDSVIRKPRNLNGPIARYDVEGVNGQVYYMSKNRL